MPSVTEAAVQADSLKAARESDNDTGGIGMVGGPAGAGGLSVAQPGLLVPTDASRFTGVLQTVNDIDAAAGLERNALQQQQAGTVRLRSAPDVGDTQWSSVHRYRETAPKTLCTRCCTQKEKAGTCTLRLLAVTFTFVNCDSRESTIALRTPSSSCGTTFKT